MSKELSPGVIRSRAIWRHNGLKGKATLIKSNAESIGNSPTATERTKEIAAQIQYLAYELIDSLQEVNNA